MARKQIARTTLTSLLVSGLVATAMTSWARPPMDEMPHGPGMMAPKEMGPRMPADPEAWKERMAERQAAKLDRLEVLLQLTEAQKPAWQAFRKEWQALHEKRFEAHRAKQDAFQETDKVLERLKLRETMLQEMIEDARKERQIVESFYDQLTDAQKRIFDQEFMPKRDKHRKPKHR